jgi:hypothetical protein
MGKEEVGQRDSVLELPSQALLVRVIKLDLEHLGIIEASPLITIPYDDLRRGFEIMRYCCAVLNNLVDLGCRQHTWRSSTLAALCAFAEFTAGMHAGS